VVWGYVEYSVVISSEKMCIAELLVHTYHAKIEELTSLMSAFDHFSVSTKISSDLCFRLPLTLFAISIISFQFCRSMQKQIWLTYIVLFPKILWNGCCLVPTVQNC